LLGWEVARAGGLDKPFLGQFPVRPGPVIFLALDDPAAVTGHRLDQLGLRDGPHLYVATPLDCRHLAPEFWEVLEQLIKSLGASLVVVDALYLFLQGGPEVMNQAGGMGPLMQRFNGLAERTGAAILLITHDNKGGGDVAGSFVIRAAAKHILRLSTRP